MARIKRGILGGVKGTVGTVAGASWNGINYVRALPEHYKDPKTFKQLNQRSKFMFTLNFHQQFTDVLRIGFKGYAKKMSGFNAALSYNLKNAVEGESPEFSINYPQFLVSRGQLTLPFNVTVAADEPGMVTLNWENNSGTGTAKTDDDAFVVIINPDKASVTYFTDEATRGEGICKVPVPQTYSGDKVHCFLAFIRMNDLVNKAGKKLVSNSVYAGEVTIS